MIDISRFLGRARAREGIVDYLQALDIPSIPIKWYQMTYPHDAKYLNQGIARMNKKP